VPKKTTSRVRKDLPKKTILYSSAQKITMSVRTELEEGSDPEITAFLFNTKVNIRGYSTLVDIIGQYDALSTKGKRQVVAAVRQAIAPGGKMFGYQKQLLIFLRWNFECPGCKQKKTAEYFAANEFDTKVPRNESSEPELISRSNCTTCGY
jgi:hypothetical protein